MEIVLSNHHLIAPNGVDTYMLTVAEHLQLLGQEVTIHALEQGPRADYFRSRGIRVARSHAELPERCDVLLAQDTSSALDLGARYPETPQVFVAHSDYFSNGIPPTAPGASQAVVVMSDRVQRHVQAMNLGLPIHRLRQPIDTRRFAPTGVSRPQARQVVLIGNYLRGARRAILLDTCRQLGLEVVTFGAEGASTSDTDVAMNEADIVIGRARVVVEAMACGRAAYVFDFMGCDGWMTPAKYAALEADAFQGQADDEVVDSERLRRELTEYTPAMGAANRDLAVHHHRAEDHVQRLMDICSNLSPPPRRDPGSYGALALVTRQAWLHDALAHHLFRQTEDLRSRLDAEATGRAVDREVDRAQRAALENQRHDLEERLRSIESQLGDTRRTLDAVQRSRRFRLAGLLARPVEGTRRRLGRS